MNLVRLRSLKNCGQVIMSLPKSDSMLLVSVDNIYIACINYTLVMLTEMSNVEPNFNSAKTNCELCSNNPKPTKL